MKNLDELRSRLEETQSKTRSCVNATKRLIDRSFLQLKESHRLLYAAERSKELLAAMLRVDELSDQWGHEKDKRDVTDINQDPHRGFWEAHTLSLVDEWKGK
jgi:hypothetical protein